MIGFYDYTVVLTYLSMLSATTGITLCLNNIGHPYIGMFFLMFCGLCDAFDGKVARTKQNRTEQMKKFGIQIDSLSDLVAFGVLPACIGIALMRCSIEYTTMPNFRFIKLAEKPSLVKAILSAIAVLYALAAMIRLAYYNVTEEERQQSEGNQVRKAFVGLPVTSSAIVCPTILLLHIFSSVDLTLLYFFFLALMGCLFISKVRFTKPGLRGILIMIGIGVIEAAALIYILVLSKK